MTPSDFNHAILDPGLTFLDRIAPAVPDTPAARVLLLAIAGQESNWSARVQGGNGPARSFWQFERAGGVRGVLCHPASKDIIRAVCAALKVPAFEFQVWTLMGKPEGDVLSVCMARLLLWTDRAPLPDMEDDSDCWDYYVRNWRPGKPHASVWPAKMQAARSVVGI